MLTLEIVSYVTTGLFQGQHKENVIKEFCVPIPCLNKNEPLPLNMPLSLKEDFKKVKIVPPDSSTHQKILAATDNVLTLLGI